MMEYRFVCPYCFKEMKDDEVAVRSEVVHQGVPDFLPEDYDGLEDFKSRYRGSDKEELLSKLSDWYFFREDSDEKYEEFWSKKYEKTTEVNPSDEVFNVKAYRRKVIDPHNSEHLRFIKQQPDGSYFLRDDSGMACGIELISGDICKRRVCKFCHNPLPQNYGRYPVKFAAIVGITGSGKTVYISQLLKGIKIYLAKVGLSTDRSVSVRTFIENNAVAKDKPLPASTPVKQLQQPLFFNIHKDIGEDRISTNTFVLYDIAGEVFKEQALVEKFAEVIQRADGIITLIDPMQFESIKGVSKNDKSLADSTTVLEAIRNLITCGGENKKCSTPIAICFAKVDMEAVQKVFSDNLKTALLEDVAEATLDGSHKLSFNAKQYAPIAKELNSFVQKKGCELYSEMKNLYSAYAYFAFTALGCAVSEKKENGSIYSYPEGPVIPKRIEEPLLWLFYKLGYIESNGHLPGEIYCPKCGSKYSRELKGADCYVLRKAEGQNYVQKLISIFKKKEEVFANRRCNDCGHEWEYKPEQ